MKSKDKTSDVNVNEEESKLSKNIKTALSYLLFFAVVIGIFLSFGEGPRVVGGYGVFNVLTRSMQSTIPQDSLVITKNVDVREIQIGDDITFMAGPTSTITHRVIAIEEDYQRSGMRAFSTQGTDNATKDKDMVVETNIVGKVIWHNYYLGLATVFLQDNCYYIIAYLLMFMLIKKIILKFMGDETVEEDDEEEPPSNQAGNSQYDTALWDASALYGQPYNQNQNMYNNQGGVAYDAYGNPIPNDYGMQNANYGYDVQYDQYGQPISYDYGADQYGGTNDNYQQW